MAEFNSGRPGLFRLPIQAARADIALLLVFALLAAGIVTGGHLLFRRYEANYRDQVEGQLAAIADLKIHELQQFRTERFADAELFNDEYFSTLVRRFIEKPRDADARTHPRSRSEGSCRTASTIGPSSWTRTAPPVVGPEGPAPVPAPVLQAVPDLFRKGEPTILDFYNDDPERRVFLELLIPFFENPAEGSPSGSSRCGSTRRPSSFPPSRIGPPPAGRRRRSSSAGTAATSFS